MKRMNSTALFFALAGRLCISGTQATVAPQEMSVAELQTVAQTARQVTVSRRQQSSAWSVSARAREAQLARQPEKIDVQMDGQNILVITWNNRQIENIEVAGWRHGVTRVYMIRVDAMSDTISDQTNVRSTSRQVVAPPLIKRLRLINNAFGWRPGQEQIHAFFWTSDYDNYRDTLRPGGTQPLLWGMEWFETVQRNKFIAQFGRESVSPNPNLPQIKFLRSYAQGSARERQIICCANVTESAKYAQGRVAILRPSALSKYPRSAEMPPELGRLHGHVLINALTRGGTPVPLWLQWGIAVLSASEMLKANNCPEGHELFIEKTAPQAAAIVARYGALNPRTWQQTAQGLQNDAYPVERVNLLEAQAQRMVRFFYAQFGSGAVVETLQRLGSGQSVDEALFATTGLSEAQFFAAWMAAEKS